MAETIMAVHKKDGTWDVALHYGNKDAETVCKNAQAVADTVIKYFIKNGEKDLKTVTDLKLEIAEKDEIIKTKVVTK